jgi:uncharacterized membrane protein
MFGDTMGNFIYDYFIQPLVDRTGYNMVNTVVYAIIALIALYIIFQIFKRCKITINQKFIFSLIPFILLGSTVRVITDSIDGGNFLPITPVHSFILSSHIFDYGFLTASPGIYLVIASILFLTMSLLYVFRRMDLLATVGYVLWLPCFLVLLPLFKFWWFAVPAVILAVIPALLTWKFTKNLIYALMVGSQALDGAATFTILDFSNRFLGTNYFEQHVISNGICGLFSTCFTFYLVKVAISMAAAYLLMKEKDASDNEKYFIALVILIMGLAPGVRDLLRVMAGT